jgi:hypothetical protein
MFNNYFFDDNYHPEGAYEIEKRVRAREEQFLLGGFQETALGSAGSRLVLIPIKELFGNLLTTPKAHKRQFAADSRK